MPPGVGDASGSGAPCGRPRDPSGRARSSYRAAVTGSGGAILAPWPHPVHPAHPGHWAFAVAERRTARGSSSSVRALLGELTLGWAGVPLGR
jgi:hypothetical protein